MLFTLNKKLARNLFTRERIPAIRLLRDRMTDAGCCPDLVTCRDIVDRIQKGIVETSNLGEKTFLVRID